jgi:hypothetical protein
MELVVFDDAESEILDLCFRLAKEKHLDNDAANLQAGVDSLTELARAISQYPSILGSRQWGSTIRSVESLVEMLCCSHAIDKLMHIPTKAVMGKGFLIAKINLFFTMKYMTEQHEELSSISDKVLQHITNIVFTVMSEEVFLALIEDRTIDIDIRNRAGFLLANIWEYRLNQSVSDFAPILNSIWVSRKANCPSYGTMMGFTELSRLSQSVPKAWLDFLKIVETSEDQYHALEEFLFSLTFEEIAHLRQEMTRMTLTSVKIEDVKTLLGGTLEYPVFDESDPREMYQFFRHRKVNARFRKRAGKDGPTKTVEEYLMSYLLSTSTWILNL